MSKFENIHNWLIVAERAYKSFVDGVYNDCDNFEVLWYMRRCYLSAREVLFSFYKLFPSFFNEDFYKRFIRIAHEDLAKDTEYLMKLEALSVKNVLNV